MRWVFNFLAAICVVFGVRAEATAEPVTIFAAASLGGALEAALEGAGPVVISYGGSGAMARQVAQGAPADIVVLANAQWMDWLEARGLLAEGTRGDLLGNALVLVGPVGADPLEDVSAEVLVARLGLGRMALGHTGAVPGGIYARQWMEVAGLWEALSPKLAETENVRAALALVARGEAPLGVVYASDAQAEPGVAVLARIDPALHAPIVYPAAIVAGRDRPEARAILQHLQGKAAQDVFATYGFLSPEAGQ